MPFGLKNVGATYEQFVNKIFKYQIGSNVKVYINNMLVKSPKGISRIQDMQETFDVLRHYQMMLNPQKCLFGVE